jgi:triosephosphate isomerase
MKKSRFFIANWKMGMPLASAQEWCKRHVGGLTALQKGDNNLVLCPNFVALQSVIELCKPAAINIGAQNCSQHAQGAYTGEVDAQSLKDVGVRYCIVGHSERRALFGETDEAVVNKIVALEANGIKPIICIGEDSKQYHAGHTKAVLEGQLRLVFPVLATLPRALIAYEPIWAIGTGDTPDINYLDDIFLWLREQVMMKAPDTIVSLIYGGSVTPDNAEELINVQQIDGLLIGGASLDFQKFEKIVSLASR